MFYYNEFSLQVQDYIFRQISPIHAFYPELNNTNHFKYGIF